MDSQQKTVDTYLKELEHNKADRPDQVREGLEIYLEMWRRAIANGVISGTDKVDEALRKLDANGGLQASAEDPTTA